MLSTTYIVSKAVSSPKITKASVPRWSKCIPRWSKCTPAENTSLLCLARCFRECLQCVLNAWKRQCIKHLCFLTLPQPNKN